jgi:hypothetical protein
MKEKEKWMSGNGVGQWGAVSKPRATRRSFLKNGIVAASAATVGAGLLVDGVSALGSGREEGGLTEGDASILRFLAAAEILETDLWQQYNELGGVDAPDSAYKTGLQQLDGDMPQYIADNTDDELSHELFINAYLKARGARPVNLEPFRNLLGSQVTEIPGVATKKRLTNLTQLTVDTSWWTRYRSDSKNPDLGDTGFDQAIPSLAAGQFPAIPRNDGELEKGNTNTPVDRHVQVISNTAAFHFGFIEQGGSSLYPSLAQRVTSTEVLRILLSIGPTETSHFQTWHDKAGNFVLLTDPTDPSLVFKGLNSAPFGGEEFQTNLIMPEPTLFLNRKFPPCSIIRPTNTKGAAMGAVNGLTKDGLFIGQSPEFFEFLSDLAHEADEAQREQ